MDQSKNPIAQAAAEAVKPARSISQLHGEKADAAFATDASVAKHGGIFEEAHAEGKYVVSCVGPREECRDEYVKLRDEMWAFEKAGDLINAAKTKALMTPMEEVKWADAVVLNLVTTVGKNLALDTILAGSSYSVTGPYLGLVSATPTPAAGDTMASHGGWTEVGGTNAPQYTAPRKTAAFSAASGGSKSLSSNLTYNITSAGTVGGCFLVLGSGAVSTIDSTAGVLYSVGAFTGGNKTVGNGDTLTVSYTASL